MTRRVQDMSDDELINIALDYADENPDFNARFVHGLEEALEDFDELTTAQREGLENIVIKFRMLDD